MLSVYNYSLISLGILLLALAVVKDILPMNIVWLDPNLLALGIAVIALGITIIALERALLPKKCSEQEVTETLEQKFRKAEKVIDAFLEESQKLGKRLAAIQREEKRKRRGRRRRR